MPSLPVVNMFVEPAPTESRGIAVQSRPGLTDRSADMGAGPVEALFKADNVLSTALFGVSGGDLYTGTTLLGNLDGTGPVSMAGYETFLFVAAGASLWGYDGTTLAAIAFPDSASVSKVIVGQSRAIAIRKDTGKFYWSDVLATSIDALAFATAESAPDRSLDLLFIDSILIIFGAETVEFWPTTGDATLPFQPLQGRVIERGIKNTGCATSIGSTFAWVTDLNQVCLTDENTVISNPGLEARIKASTECRLFTFNIEGAEFLCLRIDNETQVWSYKSRTWSEFKSWGQDNWIPQCFAKGVFGSSLDGKTFTFGSDWLDLGGVLERRLSFGFPLNSSGVTISNVLVRTNPGSTTYLTGTYADPALELRLSRDAGKTWGNWRSTTLGTQGEYRKKVEWRGLGMASRPGLLGELRITDPVDVRFSDILVNEPWGGR
nr:packaged DNA stabilization protein [Novosphingobium mathurense]